MVARQAKAIPDSGDTCFFALSILDVGKTSLGELSLSLFFCLFVSEGDVSQCFLATFHFEELGWGWRRGWGRTGGMSVCVPAPGTTRKAI